VSLRNYQGTCLHCSQEFEFNENRDYCSEECEIADRGQGLLNQIENDHRFCGSCYKPIKTVYRPADETTPELRKKALVIRESFVGFEDLTEHAEKGQYGIECSCGNISHYHAEELLRDGEPYEWFLKLSVETFREEGQREDTFCIETFCNVYWETEQFAYAIGKALQG